MITTEQTIEFLNEAFRNKRVRFSEDEIDDVRDALNTVLKRVEAPADEVTAMHRLLARCSCCEVWGEDPACELHGEGAPWGKANPDPQRAGQP